MMASPVWCTTVLFLLSSFGTAWSSNSVPVCEKNSTAKFVAEGLPCNPYLCSSLKGTCKLDQNSTVCCYDDMTKTPCGSAVNSVNQTCVGNETLPNCTVVENILQCIAQTHNLSVGECREDINVHRFVVKFILRQPEIDEESGACLLDWFLGIDNKGIQHKIITMLFPNAKPDKETIKRFEQELRDWITWEPYFTVDDMKIDPVQDNRCLVQLPVYSVTPMTQMSFTWSLQRTLNLIAIQFRNFTFDGQPWLPMNSSMTITDPEEVKDDGGSTEEEEGPNGGLIVGILFFIVFSICILIIAGYNMKERYFNQTPGDRYTEHI